MVRLAGQGLNRSEISRRTGVPRPTVSGWLRDPPPRHQARPTLTDDMDQAAYSYLLGMYLGDGHLARFPRAWCLRIVLDSRYPAIVRECVAAVRAVLPTNAVGGDPASDGEVSPGPGVLNEVAHLAATARCGHEA